MTSPLHRALRALDRFHSARPWDHNAHFHRWILRQLPARAGSALDVGCGSGDLARLLAARAAQVHGIDADPAITARARELTPATVPVTYAVADAPAGLPDESYDVITCVAVLHHLPFTETLRAFRGRLAPGGTLVVVGVSREQTPTDHLLGIASIPLNIVMALVRNRGRRAPRPASMTAPTRPAEMTFPEILREARAVLPGARLRRRLLWRYTLVWHHR
ncbi:class I SAM-dependent methyltransferase [Streptomyces purpurascens]|uniref:class I SAM-dependent methyltransferase n=1 Tax=Streptomyces purpurascens TaxID=1924 RepID=UPI00167307FE|nr:class I SAM-dependent methyltransferase [Streptomyces purpurascens]MCE7050409.1 class I SAM-dependent methyltransferase [Streptomyces purpurascens]GHA58235.1 SAM-dependent methyltransferase [Streptomyces purpurascens]